MGDRSIRIRGGIDDAHVRQAVGNVWSSYEVFYSFYFFISDKREVISTEERSACILEKSLAFGTNHLSQCNDTRSEERV